ncbi:MAG: peptidoglycan editing factor PgeF [Termitinemataceae bacterium]|nr:MAG: peptidoglycan editing factor PgeF [Termitinemataceae bacterium]
MNYEFPDTNQSRLNIFKELRCAEKNIFSVKQTHSQDIVCIKSTDEPHYMEADGLVTGCEKHLLNISVADCLPIYLYDTVSGAFGVLHSGWKGTGIVRNALKLMQESFGTKAENTAAILGPCIQSCCYEVDEQRANQFILDFGRGDPSAVEYPLGSVVKTVQDGEKECNFIDMQAANAHLLSTAGVRNISYCTNCTFSDPRLGSFRREGNERFTKMMALIGEIINA